VEKIALTKQQVYDMITKYIYIPTNNILDSGLTDQTMIMPTVRNTKVKYILRHEPSYLKSVEGVSI